MLPAAIFVSVSPVAFGDDYDERYKKAEKFQPCKEDIEKSRNQISKGKVFYSVMKSQNIWIVGDK